MKRVPKWLQKKRALRFFQGGKEEVERERLEYDNDCT